MAAHYSVWVCEKYCCLRCDRHFVHDKVTKCLEMHRVQMKTQNSRTQIDTKGLLESRMLQRGNTVNCKTC